MQYGLGLGVTTHLDQGAFQRTIRRAMAPRTSRPAGVLACEEGFASDFDSVLAQEHAACPCLVPAPSLGVFVRWKAPDRGGW